MSWGHYRRGLIAAVLPEPHRSLTVEGGNRRQAGPALSDAQGVAQKKPFHVSRRHQKMPISTQTLYPRRFSEQMEVIGRDRQLRQRERRGPENRRGFWARAERGPNITDAVQQTVISQSHSQSLTWVTVSVQNSSTLSVWWREVIIKAKLARKMKSGSFIPDFLACNTKQGI